MKRYAQILDGVVENVIESDTNPNGINGEWLECGEVGPGFVCSNGVFTPPMETTELGTNAKFWPAFDFYRKFTSQERIAIRARAKTDPVVEDIYATLNAAVASGANVRDDDPDTVQGLTYLEGIGDLAQGRAAEILS